MKSIFSNILGFCVQVSVVIYKYGSLIRSSSATDLAIGKKGVRFCASWDLAHHPFLLYAFGKSESYPRPDSGEDINSMSSQEELWSHFTWDLGTGPMFPGLQRTALSLPSYRSLEVFSQQAHCWRNGLLWIPNRHMKQLMWETLETSSNTKALWQSLLSLMLEPSAQWQVLETYHMSS